MPDLATLYDFHAAALYAFLGNLTRSETDAQDLLQAVFMRLATTAWPQVQCERSYLLTIAHRLFLDYCRRREVQQRGLQVLETEQMTLFAPPPLDALYDAEELTSALGALPAEQRAVVHLKIWEGLTLDETAQLLGIPLQTAASRYRYALKKLRSRLTTPFTEPTP